MNRLPPSQSIVLTPGLVQRETIQRKQFLLFIKILFRSLDQSEDSSETIAIARGVVADCTRRNRLGDPDYRPLMDAVDKRLRRHVGETHWKRAHLYLHHYIRQEEARSRRQSHLSQRTAMAKSHILISPVEPST
jgi:hypothetical protein